MSEKVTNEGRRVVWGWQPEPLDLNHSLSVFWDGDYFLRGFGSELHARKWAEKNRVKGKPIKFCEAPIE